MLFQFLLAPLALQGAPADENTVTPADLHPADAVFFWEASDLQQLPAAYADSPLWRIVTDPDLAKAVREVSKGEVDLDELLELARSEASLDNLPDEMLALEMDRLIGGLDGLSFSTRLAEDYPSLFNGVKQQLQTFFQVDKLGSLIGTGGFLTGEGLPANLANLEGVDPTDLIDPFGNELQYQLAGDSFTLTSHGRDGLPGGSGLDADHTFDGALGAMEIGLEEILEPTVIEHLGVRVVLEFDSAELARLAYALLFSEAAELTGEELELPTMRLPDGSALDGWVLPSDTLEELPVEFWGAVFGNHMVFGLGGASASEPFWQEAQGGFVAGLAKDPLFLASATGMPPAKGTQVSREYWGHSWSDLFVDLAELNILEASLDPAFDSVVDTSPEAMRPRLAAARQLGRVFSNAGMRRVALVDGQFERDSFTPAELRMETPVIGFEPVDREFLNFLPPEAAMVFAAPVDFAALGSLLETFIGDAAGGVPALEAHLGLDLHEDLLAHLSSQTIASLGRIRGIGFPVSLWHVKLRDSAAFQAGLAKLLGGLVALNPEDMRLNDRPYRGLPLWRLSAALPEVELPELGDLPPELTSMLGGASRLEFVFGVSGDVLVFGTKSVQVKRELKRLEMLKSGEVDEAAGVHPLVSGEVALPAGANQAIYLDWGAQFTGLYSLGKTLGTAAAAFGGVGPAFDLSALPDADVVVRHLVPTLRTTVHSEAGSWTHSRGSFGPEMWLAPGVLFAAFLGRNEVGDPFTSEEATVLTGAIEPPSPFEPAQEGPLTRGRLQHVRTVLEVYRNAVGPGYPASLGVLGEGTADFPQGLFDGEPVPADGWGRPFVYVPSSDGTSFRLYSLGADGIDQGGTEGDDIGVPL